VKEKEVPECLSEEKKIPLIPPFVKGDEKKEPPLS
jgi:hypothetical protein